MPVQPVQSAESAEMRFAHLSDWHATTLVGGGPALFRFKRLSGWASWGLTRRHRHSETILAAAFRDVHLQNVDRILVTGDLTHVSLEQEFRKAAEQLSSLGTPEEVFLIPGNHDCYVRVAPERSWDLWSDYLAGTSLSQLESATRACLVDSSKESCAPRHGDYPQLRIHGDLAMIGLCSAIPTPIFRAGGRLGRTQLDRLERLLIVLEEQNRCRVVMVHHPIAISGDSNRRALWDADEFRAVLERAGAELVIHGHKHRRRIAEVAGPHGAIPVIGVPSSSEIGSRPEKHAQYHVYTARPKEAGPGFTISGEIRGYVDATGEFEHLDDDLF